MKQRKSDSPQKAALRDLMNDYLKSNDITVKDGKDVNEIMSDMMSIILEGSLDAEMDEKLGYSKYDYNKDRENSCNGYSPAQSTSICTPGFRQIYMVAWRFCSSCLMYLKSGMCFVDDTFPCADGIAYPQGRPRSR